MNIYSKLEELYKNCECIQREYTFKEKLYSIIELIIVILLTIIFFIPIACFLIIYFAIKIIIKIFITAYKLIRY